MYFLKFPPTGEGVKEPLAFVPASSGVAVTAAVRTAAALPFRIFASKGCTLVPITSPRALRTSAAEPLKSPSQAVLAALRTKSAANLLLISERTAAPLPLATDREVTCAIRQPHLHKAEAGTPAAPRPGRGWKDARGPRCRAPRSRGCQFGPNRTRSVIRRDHLVCCALRSPHRPRPRDCRRSLAKDRCPQPGQRGPRERPRLTPGYGCGAAPAAARQNPCRSRR